MRGQYENYDSFTVIELIDELKTRVKPLFRIDDILHGMLIVARGSYHGLHKCLREYLEEDDLRFNELEGVINEG